MNLTRLAKFAPMGPDPTQSEYGSWGPNPIQNRVQNGFIRVYYQVYCKINQMIGWNKMLSVWVRPLKHLGNFDNRNVKGVIFTFICS